MHSRDRRSVTLIGLVLAAALAACGRNSSADSAGSGGRRASNGAGGSPGNASGRQAGDANASPQSQRAGESNDPDAALPEALRRSKGVYAALTSYADTGTVVQEVPGIADHSEFKTYFRRKTGDFYFDYTHLYQDDPKSKAVPRTNFTNARYVWWMRNHNFETYAFEGKDHKSYPPGSNQAATLNAPRTKGASMLIPGVLYTSSQLPSTLLQFEEASDTGIEDVDGHPCRKVIGVALQYYPSGQRTNVRQVTVWIDRDTSLVRKVFEDTPKNYGGDTFHRLTIRLQPQANPELDDKKFEFHVPDRQEQ